MNICNHMRFECPYAAKNGACTSTGCVMTGPGTGYCGPGGEGKTSQMVNADRIRAKKVYIAGQITGNKYYRGEFAEAEKKLRELGYIPINPAILPEGLDSRDYMRICLAMLDSADAIALLPTWAHSGGAKIEVALAEYTGKQVIHTWMIPDDVGRFEERGAE